MWGRLWGFVGKTTRTAAHHLAPPAVRRWAFRAGLATLGLVGGVGILNVTGRKQVPIGAAWHISRGDSLLRSARRSGGNDRESSRAALQEYSIALAQLGVSSDRLLQAHVHRRIVEALDLLEDWEAAEQTCLDAIQNLVQNSPTGRETPGVLELSRILAYSYERMNKVEDAYSVLVHAHEIGQKMLKEYWEEKKESGNVDAYYLMEINAAIADHASQICRALGDFESSFLWADEAMHYLGIVKEHHVSSSEKTKLDHASLGLIARRAHDMMLVNDFEAAQIYAKRGLDMLSEMRNVQGDVECSLWYTMGCIQTHFGQDNEAFQSFVKASTLATNAGLDDFIKNQIVEELKKLDQKKRG
jgi:hypothetical protein